jgi:CRISPR-associated exonuclease Cas4
MDETGTYTEADLLPLSGLAHIAFCERRWALVHLEQQWQDNRYTAEGNVLHETAHSGASESRPGALIRRTLPLRSFSLGLSGQADIVEFLPSSGPGAIPIKGRRGLWTPFPVEYKRSRDRDGSIAYRLQLCAQAMCMEEMLGATVPSGAIYDATTRRRQPVEFSEPVRVEVRRMAQRMHQLHSAGLTPGARLIPACRKCSLVDRCLPGLLQDPPRVDAYIRKMLRGSG